MARTYLDFERPLVALDARIDALGGRGAAAPAELGRLRQARRRIERRISQGLSAWERVQLARHVDRPQTLDYVATLCPDFFELHGDRACRDDAAIVAGVGTLAGRPVAVVGHQRGHGTRERVRRSFGMASPEGYRKARRLFDLAERLAIPVVTFLDTQGAYAGVGAEERGQAEAIARSMQAMMLLRVPIVSVVIGEGGSGGALALGVADRVLMQEHACYSVISPEGCAAILYRDRSRPSVARAAEALRLTARELRRAGLIDELLREPRGGAHRDPERARRSVCARVTAVLARLARVRVETLVARRVRRHRRIGGHVG